MWMNRGQRRRKAPRESKGSEQSHQFYGSQLNGAKCDHIAWWPVSAIRSGLQRGYLPRGYPWASLRVCLHLLCSRLIWPCVGIKSLFLPNHNQATFFPHHFFFFVTISQIIWQPQPAVAYSWKQMHFSLEPACLWKAWDGHSLFSVNRFAPGRHPYSITGCKASPWPLTFVSPMLKTQGIKKGLHMAAMGFSFGIFASHLCICTKLPSVWNVRAFYKQLWTC